MPLMMDDPLDQDAFDPAAAAAAMGSEALDHEIDMEDLFGADAAVNMPALPMPGSVANRLMEMKECGACQRVAWSKYGPIATISAGSKELKGSALVQDQQTGRWALSKSVPIKLPDGYHGTLKHVCWSFVGQELAVTDTNGCILIFSAALGHSHIDLRRIRTDGDDAGEMSCVVGMHWLPPYPQAHKVKAFWSAQSDGDEWSWQSDEHRSTGPSNPIEGKAALITMSRHGKLRLQYQMFDSSWREATTQVDDMLFDQDTYVTHASFAPDRDDGLFMATHDTCHNLRLYQLKIDWAVQQQAHPDGQQPPHKIVNPTTRMTATKIVTECIPTGTDLPEAGDLSAFGTTDQSQYMLTHLELIPPSLDRNQAEQHRLFPTIITAFKHVASILPPLAGAPQSNPMVASSMIWSWEIASAQQSGLSSAFDQLAAKRKGTDSVRPKTFLSVNRHSITPVHNTILSINPTRYNTVLVVAMADGSVEFLKRDTMDPMQAEYNFSSVYSMSQSGFIFSASEPVTCTELSPNMCCAISVFAEGEEIKLRRMESTIVDLTNPEDTQQRSAVAAMLALQWSRGLSQFTSCLDDVYATVQPDADIDLRYEILEKTYSAMGINLDFNGEDAHRSSQMFFRANTLLKLMGQQAVLERTKTGRRSVSAKAAYVMLNIRLATYVTMMVFRQDLMLKADVAKSLSKMVQWCLDFMIYLLQEVDRLSEHLIHLASGAQTPDDAQSPSPYDDRAAIEAFVASEGSPALVLLLSSSTRMLLKMVSRPLRHGWIHCINGERTAATPPTREAFSQALAKYNSSPICKQGAQGQGPGIVFDIFIVQLEMVVRDAYSAANISAAERARVERDLFVRARIPDVLMPAIKRLVTETWPKFVASPNVNLGAIYKHDVAWLGFTEDRYTREWHKRNTVDVVRKTIMPVGAKGLKVRTCTRCRSKMEDIQPGPQHPAWVMANMKNCICLGNWGEVEG